MTDTEQTLRHCIAQSETRHDLRGNFLNCEKLKHVLELGALRGLYASEILGRC